MCMCHTFYQCHLSFMSLWYDARNDVLPCWIGPTNCQLKWLRTRSAEIWHETNTLTVDPIMLEDEWIMNETVWTRSSAIAAIADRTACSILTLFIAIATSRPQNKKICSLSVRGSNCRSASAVRTRHSQPAVTAACEAEACRDGAVLCVIVDKRGVPLRRPCTRVAWIHRLHLRSFSLFVCILWLNDTSYSKSVKRDK